MEVFLLNVCSIERTSILYDGKAEISLLRKIIVMRIGE
jgi:hypothetical protein